MKLQDTIFQMFPTQVTKHNQLLIKYFVTVSLPDDK